MEKSERISYQTAKKFSVSGKISFFDMQFGLIKTVDKKRHFLKDNTYSTETQYLLDKFYERNLKVVYQRMNYFKCRNDFNSITLEKSLEKIIKTLFVIKFIVCKDKSLPIYYDDMSLKKEFNFSYGKGVIAFSTWKDSLVEKLSNYHTIVLIAKSEEKFIIPSSAVYEIDYSGIKYFGVTLMPNIILLIGEMKNHSNCVLHIFDGCQIHQINKKITSYEKNKENNYIIGMERDLKNLKEDLVLNENQNNKK